jgi:N-formylglutamate deformylase
MEIYEFHQGTRPLLISIPHAGTEVPASIAQRFSAVARRLPDTDWYVDALYGFARDLGASIIKANYSRYVVDVNRATDSSPLYTTSPTSAVCPTHAFEGQSIYIDGLQPDAGEIRTRVERYWRPYHARIATELEQIRKRHGAALLWDAHSIASQIPALFDGELPEFNFGTCDDATCPRELAVALVNIVNSNGRFGAVLNGRFKGGYITHHYGRPAQRIYAVQLELAQRAYMDEGLPRIAWDARRAQPAAALIARVLHRFMDSIAS